jgi:hypothetical protein
MSCADAEQGLPAHPYLTETPDWQGFRVIETGRGLVADVGALLSHRIAALWSDSAGTMPKFL